MFRAYPKGINRPYFLMFVLNQIEKNILKNDLPTAFKTMKFVLSGINADADRVPFLNPKEITFFSTPIAAKPYARVNEVLDKLTDVIMLSSDWERCLQQAQLLQAHNRYQASIAMLKKVLLAPEMENQPTNEQRHSAKMMLSVMGSSVKVEMRAKLGLN